MCSMIHIKKNYKMIYTNTLILMKNVQKLSCMTEPIKGFIHFELQKVYQKKFYICNQQRSRF